jgi:hypothetical protein
MLDVYFTVDVEIWCDGWQDIDAKFPEAFRRYVYGPTARGDFGLAYQLRLLQAHGLTGSFFVEPLFTLRFGAQPLAEIVGLILQYGHEAQLHLHTEWLDEAREPLLPDVYGKRQYLRMFSLEEQQVIVAKGLELLRRAGEGSVNAFRAGSFGFNSDTLRALAANQVAFDSSYNATMFGPDSGVMPGTTIVEPFECDGVHEYPMTVFKDGIGAMRHAQLTACSFKEMESLLWRALEAERKAFVILSHNFELLNQAKSKPDDIVVRRFRRLCAFFERNRDCFRVRGFRNLQPKSVSRQPTPLSVPFWTTAGRVIAQAYRRTRT